MYTCDSLLFTLQGRKRGRTAALLVMFISNTQDIANKMEQIPSKHSHSHGQQGHWGQGTRLEGQHS